MEGYETNSEDTGDASPGDDYDDIFFRDDFDFSVEDDYDVHMELIHFIGKKRSVSSIDTDAIENARRFVFAEHLVSYIAFEFHGLVYNTRLTKDSDFFFNPFCKTIKHAARIIRREINNTNTTSFEIIGDLIKSYKLCYEIFVDAVLGHYSHKHLNTGQLFYFCVYFSELAAKCYRIDFKEVLDFAVYAILDAFCAYKGKIYELIDFAKAVVHKSDQSVKEDNMVKIFGINLEKLKMVGKSDKHEIMNDLLRLSIKENVDSNQENELTKCEAALEQLNLVDKHDKYEVIGKFEFPIDAIVEKLVKSVEFHVNNCNLTVCSEFCCMSLMDKVHDRKCEKMSHPIKFFEDILQEVLSVVNFEASLFLAIYTEPKNELNLESKDNSHSEDTRDKMDSSKCSSFQNIQVRETCLFKEHDCLENEIETSVNATITSNSVIAELEKQVEPAGPGDTLQNADVEFPSGESKVFELDQNQFVAERSAINNVKNSPAGSAMDFVQELERKSDDIVGIVDYNTTNDVKYNFVEKETKTLKEAAIISNCEFKQKENKKTLEGFSDTLEYENLNSENIELKKLGTVLHPMICDNFSENNKKVEENFKHPECKSIEDLDCIFDKNTVDSKDEQIVDFFAIYKSEGEINEENLRVLKGETILFAEDFVRYIMKEFYGISFSESKLDGIRCLSSNAFNETVKQVLNFIHDKSEILNRITFDIIANAKECNTDCYRKYVASLLSHYVEDGLNSDAFLYFCQHFSELAAKFFTLDHPEIVDFAFCSILDAFCLLKDDWCQFKVATEKIADIFKTKTDDQCTGCKIHCCVDNFERECVKVILDALKDFLHEKIDDVISNTFMTVEKENHALLSKTLENRETDVVNSQS